MKSRSVIEIADDSANALHLAMMEAKRRSGLTQTEIAARLGMPQPNVLRIEHSDVVTFSTLAQYLTACGFDFGIKLRRIPNVKGTSSKRKYHADKM